MELFLKLAAAAVLIMLLFYLWPTYKAWQENGPKAEKGDWQAVVLPLAAVVGFVIVLIMLVR
jgi:TRAP-type C4-dicarboxylate transport system permease small subunit